MTDDRRIEGLRRRVQRDPASIAFAQLAEEHRRAGQFEDAVRTSIEGLAHHPDYPSARVTLGRALAELGRFGEAQLEFERVLQGAPDNLAAVRGLAEILHKRGAVDEALVRYREALSLAPRDPQLAGIVAALSGQSGAGDFTARAGGSRPDRDRSIRVIAALEGWLNALHVARAHRHA